MPFSNSRPIIIIDLLVRCTSSAVFLELSTPAGPGEGD